MPINVLCPQCKTVLSFPTNPPVKAGRCPRCQSVVTPPAQEQQIPMLAPYVEPPPAEIPVATLVDDPPRAGRDPQGLTREPARAPVSRRQAAQDSRPGPGSRRAGRRPADRPMSPVLLACVVGGPVLAGLIGVILYLILRDDGKPVVSGPPVEERPAKDRGREVRKDRGAARDGVEQRDFPPNDRPFEDQPGREPIRHLVRLPARPDAVPIQPPANPPASVALPDTVSAVAVGGGGRFLVLHFSGINKLGILDVNKLEIVHYIFAESAVRFAAGMNALALYRPATEELERWSLLTGKKEHAVRFAHAGSVKQLCMGSASEGPLMISCQLGNGFNLGSHLFDLATFEVTGKLGTPDGTTRPVSLGDGLFWASADGRVFGSVGDGGGSPNGVTCHRLQSGWPQRFYEHQTTGFAQPSPDGKYLYAGGHGVLTNRVQKTPDAVFSTFSGHVSHNFLPAHHGPYYLHVHCKSPRPNDRKFHPDDPDLGVTIYMLGQSQPLLQVSAPSITPYDNWHALSGIGLNKSIHLIPKAKLLIVIPPERNRLALYPVDLDAALDRLRGDYLVVNSDPPGTVPANRKLRYTVTARAGGAVSYKLESGPDGMTVSPDGRLAWDVPANYPGPSAEVSIRAQSDRGAQAFHNFSVAVPAAGSP